jgi:predicted nucleic acid-binding protein
MSNLVLPDSSFYITATRTGRDPLVELGAKADDYEIATCGLVQIEVLRGRSDPHVLRRFRDTFAVMIYIATTNATWERATQLAWSLDRQGIVIPATDLIIAACALQTGAAVLTYDTHFRQIPGLQVVDHLD